MKRAILFAAAVAAFGQVDLTKLANPPKDSWWTYHGDYTGQRNSKLGAITVGDTPGEYLKFLRKDYERWARVIKAAGVKAE